MPDAEITKASNRHSSMQEASVFVQKQIRYVAVEIGIGGYQPHHASEIFRNRFGDCKDKVTLLKSLRRLHNQEVYPVLIHSGGHDLEPDFPSPLYFNHVIAAMPLEEGAATGPAVLDHPTLGRLQLFDPTDSATPFGQLPPSLQGTKALLVEGEQGHVIDVPVTLPAYNRIFRRGNFQLDAYGRLQGTMEEQYRGVSASRERNWLQGRTHEQWLKGAVGFVARWLPGAVVKKFSVGNFRQTGPLNEKYEIVAPYFAQPAGNFLILRPCVLGSKAILFEARKERKFPFQFQYLRSQSDIFEVVIPEGYQVSSLPGPVEWDLPFAYYRATVTQEGNVLKYVRTLEIKKRLIPAEKVADLRNFYRMVDRDESSVILLKKVSEAPKEVTSQ